MHDGYEPRQGEAGYHARMMARAFGEPQQDSPASTARCGRSVAAGATSRRVALCVTRAGGNAWGWLSAHVPGTAVRWFPGTFASLREAHVPGTAPTTCFVRSCFLSLKMRISPRLSCGSSLRST